MQLSNNRGKFRQMEMNELKLHAQNPLFTKVEHSQLLHNLPLDIKNQTAIASGRELSLGIPPLQLKMIGPFLTTASPDTHIGPFAEAIDFLIADETEILATHDGVIIEVIENFSEWGDGPEYRDKLNYLTIQHSGSKDIFEFSQYCHLAAGSVSEYGLQKGSVVKAGQKIARVGKSGWTDRDHLHFVVFRLDHRPENPFRFKSLKVKFVNC